MIATQNLTDLFLETRAYTEKLCKPLQIEDYVVQPIVDVSPPKWHLGHTTWFFEEFILKHHKPGHTIYSDDYAFVFNSYYESIGKRVVRTDRGNLSRPTVAQVYAYREYVTAALAELLETHSTDAAIIKLVTVGIHHEKQHQELLLTDIKYILGNNPLMPAYDTHFPEFNSNPDETSWITINEGVYDIGYDGTDFCYDNELGKHKVYIHECKIASTLVTNGDYLEFIKDGGYTQALLWHAEGWDWVQQNNIKAPQYWHHIEEQWHQYTLAGLKTIDLQAPVTHISYFEAAAFAQWKGLRLPTEFEWEIAQSQFDWGQRWEWTESAYLPYPNYSKEDGALGEYNGKFMVSQKVLRGGSVATPAQHTRATYRNFFHPPLRWQYTGIRLAQ